MPDGGNGYGYVYRLNPQEGGGFNLSSLYSFGKTNGFGPEATPLLKGGVLYGTVEAGGATDHFCQNGCGGVYRLKPTSSGPAYTFLGFGTADNNVYPMGSLISDPSGNLYGTTSRGGPNGAGTVFEVTP
jgi:uncharacterized repeat protein (TIGR03803 family)